MIFRRRDNDSPKILDGHFFAWKRRYRRTGNDCGTYGKFIFHGHQFTSERRSYAGTFDG